MTIFIKQKNGSIQKREFDKDKIKAKDFAKQFGAEVSSEEEWKAAEVQKLKDAEVKAAQNLESLEKKKELLRSVISQVPNVSDEQIEETISLILGK